MYDESAQDEATITVIATGIQEMEQKTKSAASVMGKKVFKPIPPVQQQPAAAPSPAPIPAAPSPAPAPAPAAQRPAAQGSPIIPNLFGHGGAFQSRPTVPINPTSAPTLNVNTRIGVPPSQSAQQTTQMPKEQTGASRQQSNKEMSINIPEFLRNRNSR